MRVTRVFGNQLASQHIKLQETRKEGKARRRVVEFHATYPDPLCPTRSTDIVSIISILNALDEPLCLPGFFLRWHVTCTLQAKY
jgi:hypothetical protein